MNCMLHNFALVSARFGRPVHGIGRRHFTGGSTSVNIVFILGGPGVGKGTQCEMAVREFNNNSNAESTFDSHTPGISRVLHLSAGELLRCELADPTSTAGAEISKCIADGVIVPAEITVQLLRAQIETFADKAQFSIGPGDPVPMVLVDGFPRNMDNLECWNRIADTNPRIPRVHNIVYFEGSEEVLLARLKKRSVTSDRTDDNGASIAKRFDTFRQSTLPVLQLPGHTVRVVDAGGSKEDVYQQFRASLLLFSK